MSTLLTGSAVLWVYFGILVILSIYGLHRYVMVYWYFKYKHRQLTPTTRFEDLPKVTVQLPVYNEATVIARLIQSVAAFDYPKDRLFIQVLDDSTDETSEIAAKEVEEVRKRGIKIDHIRRTDRTGFKAGALAAGLTKTDSEFVAIFDADFVPKPDMLKRTIHYFTNEKIGMVQVRWGHLNREHSLLTRLQSIFLDGHFMIEHTARNRSGRFFNFNGTAGVWRRGCIEEAGGWQHDTLTEDLDLSYRAQLKGWQFVFVPDVTSPAELPVEMSAFKSQQHRWAKGSIQTSMKMLPTIWRSDESWKIKLEATFHLTSNMAYVLMIVLCLLMYPALRVRSEITEMSMAILFDLAIFMAATSSVVSFYLVSQKEIYPNWRSQLKYLPALLSLGIGLAVNNARAVLEALLGVQSSFVRTPKYASGGDTGSETSGTQSTGKGQPGPKKTAVHRYRIRSRGVYTLIELALAGYFVFVTGFAIQKGLWVSSFFLALFLFGFMYVGLATVFSGRRQSGPVRMAT